MKKNLEHHKNCFIQLELWRCYSKFTDLNHIGWNILFLSDWLEKCIHSVGSIHICKCHLNSKLISNSGWYESIFRARDTYKWDDIMECKWVKCGESVLLYFPIVFFLMWCVDSTWSAHGYGWQFFFFRCWLVFGGSAITFHPQFINVIKWQ